MEFRNIKSLDELIKYADSRSKESISIPGAAMGAIKGIPEGPGGMAAGAALGGFQIKDVLGVLDGTSFLSNLAPLLKFVPDNLRTEAADFVRQEMTKLGLHEDDTMIDIAGNLISHFTSGSSDHAAESE